MSIFRHEVRWDRQDRRPDMTPAPRVSVTIAGSEQMSASEFPFKRKYTLEVRAYQEFWCNDAQLDRATQNAREGLSRIVYDDILRLLPHLRACLYGGDTQGALEAVDAIEGATKP